MKAVRDAITILAARRLQQFGLDRRRYVAVSDGAKDRPSAREWATPTERNGRLDFVHWQKVKPLRRAVPAVERVC